MIALVGRFGMVLGQQAVETAKRHFVPPAQTSIQHDMGGARAEGTSPVASDDIRN